MINNPNGNNSIEKILTENIYREFQLKNRSIANVLVADTPMDESPTVKIV